MPSRHAEAHLYDTYVHACRAYHRDQHRQKRSAALGVHTTNTLLLLLFLADQGEGLLVGNMPRNRVGVPVASGWGHSATTGCSQGSCTDPHIWTLAALGADTTEARSPEAMV